MNKDFDIQSKAMDVLQSWRTETVDSVKLGFTFASALAWNEVMRVFVDKYFKKSSNTVLQTSLYALAITFVSGVIMYLMNLQGLKSKKTLKLSN